MTIRDILKSENGIRDNFVTSYNGIPERNRLLEGSSKSWGTQSHLKSTWNSRGACAASRAPCRLRGLALSAAAGTLPGDLSDGER